MLNINMKNQNKCIYNNLYNCLNTGTVINQIVLHISECNTKCKSYI